MLRVVSTLVYVKPYKSLYQTIRCAHTSKGAHKYLISEQHLKLLTANENTCQVQSSDILYYESNQLAANAPCEDRISVCQVKGTDMYFFNVCDGHGGWHCSSAIKYRLPYYMALYLLEDKELTWRTPTANTEWIVPISGDKSMAGFSDKAFQKKTIESFIHRYNNRLKQSFERTFAERIIDAFEDLDEDIGAEAMPDDADIDKPALERLLTATSGSCAISCVVNNGTLHVAGLGDCRAVLGSHNKEGDMTATVLTEEHRTYNPIERERLIREHPYEDEDIMFFDERLCGILQPTRAFGDVAFKWSTREKMLLEWVFDQSTYIPNYHSPPYLSCSPDIHQITLSSSDQFMIIATDGLWDGLSDEESVQLLKQCPPDVNGATWLIEHSLAQGNDKKLARILSVPPGNYCRSIRDDISVIIVYFNT